MMPVDLRVRIRRGNKEIEIIARANTAFSPEKDLPMINITLKDWEKLGRPEPEGYIPVRPYAQRSELYAHAFKVHVKVIAKDRESNWAEAYAIIHPEVKRRLLNDSILERLNIVIVKPRRGL